MQTKLARIIGLMMEKGEVTQTGLVAEEGCPIPNRHRIARLMGGQTAASTEEQAWLMKRLDDDVLFGADGRALPTTPTRLATYRQERGFTVEQMAQKANLSVDIYQDVENGAHAPSEMVRQRIAGVLGRSEFDVFDKRHFARLDYVARQEPAVAAS